MTTFKVGDIVLCNYPDYVDSDGELYFRFEGTIVLVDQVHNRYGVKVHPDTGHKEEGSLHNLTYSVGNTRVVALPEGGGWWLEEDEVLRVLYKELPYDPTQSGDTDDDI